MVKDGYRLPGGTCDGARAEGKENSTAKRHMCVSWSGNGLRAEREGHIWTMRPLQEWLEQRQGGSGQNRAAMLQRWDLPVLPKHKTARSPLLGSAFNTVTPAIT